MANPQSKSYAEILAKNVRVQGTLTVVGTTNIANISLVDATITGNTQIGNAASDTVDLQSLLTVKTNQKIQFRDTGLYIYSSADGQLDIVADTTLALSGAITTNSTLTLGGKINLYKIGSAAASASGLLAGVGTTANPALTSTAGANFIEIRSKTTATSGDNRSVYLRHEIAGAGASGETIRAFTKLTGAVATARGAHISLDLDATGSTSGFGAGLDAQVMLGATAYSSTLTALNLEIYGNASATITGATSMIRPVINGDGTAVANINANAFFLDLSSVTASSSGFIDTDITALTGYGGLKVKCPDGLTRYIPITTGS